jgi:DNA-binding protein
MRARGQAIEKAIDTVQMLKRGFLKDVNVESINLGSEDVTRLDGTRGNISIIEIILSRESGESTEQDSESEEELEKTEEVV